MHAALAEAGIGHGFGGAIALAYAVDEPRATVGIDLNISGDPEDPEPTGSSGSQAPPVRATRGSER